jgi:hypothetical protein
VIGAAMQLAPVAADVLLVGRDAVVVLPNVAAVAGDLARIPPCFDASPFCTA